MAVMVRWHHGIAIAVLVAAALVASVASAQSSAIVPVGRIEGRLPAPQVVVDALGVVHVVAWPLRARYPWQHFIGGTGGFVEDPVSGLGSICSQAGRLLAEPTGSVVIIGPLEDDYDDSTNPSVIARKGPAGWDVVSLPLESAESCKRSAAFDAGGRLHVVSAYGCDFGHCGCPGGGHAIEYASGTPGGPFDTAVVSSECGSFASDPLLSLGPEDQVHLAWFVTDGDVGSVRYATGGPGAWQVASVAKIGGLSGAYTSTMDLAVDQRNRPHLVYFDARAPKPHVVYATRGGRRWSKQSMGALTYYPSIAVGPDATVHVVYDRPQTKRGVYHAQRRGTKWRRQLVAGVAGNSSTDVFVDGAGGVHVAFHDPTSGVLEYARR
jgi:hypothetical protein